jgi:hypothetical protein
MAYQINKTDGTVVSTVADGQIDNKSTDLTLIGKNYSGFGESLNENFIKLLENFAGTSRPTQPLRGQVWFDVSELKLKVYNGSEFLPVSSATVSNTQPTTLAIGDLWFNNVAGQLYFFDGTNPILLGPSYSSTQGLSGLKVDSILDTLNQTRVITSLYNNGILLGIFAKDSFTPKNAIIGFNGNIQPGFNAGTLSGIKFNVTCTNAEQLGGADATTYVRKDTSNIINGQLRITADNASGGLVVGSAGQANLFVNGGNIFLSNAASDRNITFGVIRGVAQEDAIIIESANRNINLYAGFLSSEVNVGGNLTIAGNLTVEGTTTTINTSNVTIEDKNLTLANVVSPTDVTADGAGITIKGTTDKTITYSQTNNWLDISEDINLGNLKSILINGVPMIQPNLPPDGTYRLGNVITGIPGVQNFGTLSNVDIGDTPSAPQLRIETDGVSGNPRISTLSSSLDLELAPDGAGNVVLIGSPKIIGLSDPTNGQDAATKAYVDNTVRSRSLAFSIDLSDGKSNSYIIANILNNLAPVSDYNNGTVARILCSIISNSSTTLDINPLRNLSGQQFVTDSMFNTSPALTNITFTSAALPAPAITTTRIIKTFSLAAGIWTWQSDTILPP